MKKFVLYSEEIREAFLTKDICLIPFIMQKYYNYESKIICNNISDDLVSNEKYLENINIVKLTSVEILIGELKNADILMFQGPYEKNLNLIEFYKCLNPNGKVYLKMDANLYWMFNFNKSMKDSTLNTLKKCDLITIEDRNLQYILNSVWRVDIKYLSNGFYEFIDDSIIDFNERENIIISVGRIGTFVKNNKLLLEAFAQIKNEIGDWKLKFVGPVESSFQLTLIEYFNKYPEIVDSVTLEGNQNKEELKNQFKRAKISCLTSFTESCAHVLSESVYNGCYLISTNVDGANDIIDYGRYGRIISVGNLEQLKESLIEACKNEKMLNQNSIKAQIYAREKLSFIKNCKLINDELSK